MRAGKRRAEEREREMEREREVDEWLPPAPRWRQKRYDGITKKAPHIPNCPCCELLGLPQPLPDYPYGIRYEQMEPATPPVILRPVEDYKKKKIRKPIPPPLYGRA